MNIKLNVSGLMNIIMLILVLILMMMIAGCAADPHGLRHKNVIYDTVTNTGECGNTISIARCDYLVKRN